MAALGDMAAHSLPPHPGPALPPHTRLTLTLPALPTPATVDVELLCPPPVPSPSGLVVVVHPRGCTAASPGMHQLAVALQEGGYVAVMADLLSEAEAKEDELTERYRHDLLLLDQRLDAVIRFVRAEQPRLAALPLALVGSATGAAVALVDDVHHSGVRAIVSRGGLPHLAGSHLCHVSAPVLLIVGSADCGVWEDNKEAYRQLASCPHKRLHVVPNARHHFQETGAMDDVIRHTRDWLDRWLAGAGKAGQEGMEVEGEEKGRVRGRASRRRLSG